MSLRDERCEACTGATPRLDAIEVEALRLELHPDWSVTSGGMRLRRDVRVADFAAALALSVRCGMVAEAQGHHPDLTVAWGRLGIELWTHAVGGLTRTDLVLAAHLDAVLDAAPV